MEIAKFTFNPFQENTYILYDETSECVILDPGCNTMSEQTRLDDFISSSGLKPVRLINTHCHIDHVLGNKYVQEKYGLGLEIHREELDVLRSCEYVSNMYGIPYDTSPEPARYIKEKEIIKFGNTELVSILTPGHSPASLSFYCKEKKMLMAGDVLFYESIGRTDLPGGDHQTLLLSIKNHVLTLEDDVVVFPGHGPSTTIGHERVNNPFLKELN
jgi:glyoxylase-like metal-dependent hydrolase (beta-lactamase superfamily II)